MSWRTILITKPAKISIKDNNFLYSPTDDKKVVVPIDEISAVIIETPQVVITSALLSRLANENIVLFSCDDSHIPNGIFNSFHQHSRFSLMAHLQTKWSTPFKKQIWQKIIKQKILNQAQVLDFIGKTTQANKLRIIVNNVKSGDNTNRESYAARIYFQELFDDFIRGKKTDLRNSALNYGYSILRGMIARDISASGLIPALGVHHNNQLNAFNLVDDFIEPFRTFVDFSAYKMLQVDLVENYELSKEQRIELLEILQQTVLVDNEKSILLGSSELVINSFIRAIKNNNPQELVLPTFLL
jgi:CRISPR-associated protein Cas1